MLRNPRAHILKLAHDADTIVEVLLHLPNSSSGNSIIASISVASALLTSCKTSTRVFQVTGCLPLPAIHCWRISVLIRSASLRCSWTRLLTLDPVLSSRRRIPKFIYWVPISEEMSIIRIFPRNLIHSIRVGRLAWTGLGNETCFPVSGEQGNSICWVKAVLIPCTLYLIHWYLGHCTGVWSTLWVPGPLYGVWSTLGVPGPLYGCLVHFMGTWATVRCLVHFMGTWATVQCLVHLMGTWAIPGPLFNAWSMFVLA